MICPSIFVMSYTKVEGTKKIDILGVQSDRIYLKASNAKIVQLGIEPSSLIQILKEQNIIRSGGLIDTDKKVFSLSPIGNFSSLEDVGSTLISAPNSEDAVPLSDLVSVYRHYVNPLITTANLRLFLYLCYLVTTF